MSFIFVCLFYFILFYIFLYKHIFYRQGCVRSHQKHYLWGQLRLIYGFKLGAMGHNSLLHSHFVYPNEADSTFFQTLPNAKK